MKEKNSLKGIIGKYWKYIIPGLWILLGYASDIYIMIVYGRSMLDSDMASEMLLSNLLNNEGKLITDSYYYSTEIRFVTINLLYRIGLLLSPDNWHVARVIGMALGYTLLAVLCIGVGKALKLKEWGLWFCALVLFPGGYWYFFWTIFGGYYLTYIYFTLASIWCLVVCVSTKKTVIRIVNAVLLACLAFASGGNGVKQTMFFYAPLLVAVVIMLLMEGRRNASTKEESADIDLKPIHTSEALHISQVNREQYMTVKEYIKANQICCRYLVVALFMFVFNCAGYLFNCKYLATHYSFADYTEVGWEYKGVLDGIKEFVHSYGYYNGYKVFCLRGVASGCGMVIGVLILFSAVRLVFKLNKLSFEERFLYILSVAEIAGAILMMAYFQKGHHRYYQPVLMFGLMLIVLEIKNEKFCIKNMGFFVMNLIAIMYFLASAGSVKNQVDYPKRAVYGSERVEEWLEDNGYENGIASFWNANLLNELSDGKLNMWRTGNRVRLQEKYKKESWPSGRTFVVFETHGGEADTSSSLYELVEQGEGFEVYRDEVFIVYEVNGDLLNK